MASALPISQRRDAVKVSERASRPIDLVHLARQCLGDQALEQEILILFDKTIAGYGTRLSDGDLAMTLHTIKGAASGVGAWGVADLAKAGEAELRETGTVSAERIGDIGLAIEEVRSFIARLMGHAPA